MATGERPVLEVLADINAVSLARAGLDPVTLLLVRIGALVAVDAPAASYLMRVGPAVQSGVTFEQVQDVLVAVAPITGAPRVLSAAGNIADALGIVIAVARRRRKRRRRPPTPDDSWNSALVDAGPVQPAAPSPEPCGGAGGAAPVGCLRRGLPPRSGWADHPPGVVDAAVAVRS